MSATFLANGILSRTWLMCLKDVRGRKPRGYKHSKTHFSPSTSVSILLKIPCKWFLIIFKLFSQLFDRCTRLPQIYDEFYHTINNADHEKDLRWWSNTHGVNMPMAWPQFEVRNTIVFMQVNHRPVSTNQESFLRRSFCILLYFHWSNFLMFCVSYNCAVKRSWSCIKSNKISRIKACILFTFSFLQNLCCHVLTHAKIRLDSQVILFAWIMLMLSVSILGIHRRV